MMNRIRVVLFDDNAKVRDAMSMLLGATPGLEFGGAFPDATHLAEDLSSSRPDVVLMDIDMPVIGGIAAVRAIRSRRPDIRIIMQTVFDDSDKIFLALCAGAHGYILKNTPPVKIIEAIHEVAQGGAPMSPSVASKVLRLFALGYIPKTDEPKEDYTLSPREKEVLKLLVAGKAYKMIGADLHISYDTVRAHMKRIYEKLHVTSMTEAVAKAIQEKLV